MVLVLELGFVDFVFSLMVVPFENQYLQGPNMYGILNCYYSVVWLVRENMRIKCHVVT